MSEDVMVLLFNDSLSILGKKILIQTTLFLNILHTFKYITPIIFKYITTAN